MERPGGDAAQAVTGFLRGAGLPCRTVAPGEWGLVVEDVGGAPLEVGLRLSDGLLRAQAWVAPPGTADPHVLLHRNRLAPLARYAHSGAGDVHVHADIPASALDDALLDRLLVALVQAAEVARSGLGGAPTTPARRGGAQAAWRRDWSRYLR
jgi:hypothetical protein